MIKIIPKPKKVAFDKDSKLVDFRGKITEVIDDELNLKREGYLLSINGEGITIKAKTQQGILYGYKTLEQIKEQFGMGLPYCEIEDEPSFDYRGFMFDCCRHFFSVEEIKRHLNIMSKLKLNVFHWHLTEDQGWRIEIKKYPKLNKIGSARKETRGDKRAHTGFYTKNEIREVVEYAKKLNIDVMPEFNVPGHFSSAIASYPYLSCKGEEIEVKTTWGIFSDIACMGRESTYRFIFDVLDEIIELFPYEYIHLGGDEAIKTDVIECRECIKMIKENNLNDTEELQAHFMSRIVDYLEIKGKKVINWNDGATSQNTSPKITIQHWHASKESVNATLEADNKGCDIILSPFFEYYLDYPYGMTGLKKTYEYDLKLKKKQIKNLKGLEAPIWTEYVDSQEQLDYMVYPRLIAVADVAWGGSEGKNYEDFELRLIQFSKILDKNNIKYAKITQVNPTFIDGKKQVVKFFLNAAKGNIIKQQRINNKAKKKIKKFNKSLQSN